MAFERHLLFKSSMFAYLFELQFYSCLEKIMYLKCRKLEQRCYRHWEKYWGHERNQYFGVIRCFVCYACELLFGNPILKLIIKY
jgi:hypothetical protein